MGERTWHADTHFSDGASDGCRVKKQKKWGKYIRGASAIFARYACGRGIVRVLTLPPLWAQFLRPISSYRTIEEPVLKGSFGCFHAVQINHVHLLARSADLEYQTWPEDHMSEELGRDGTGSIEFRLPPRILRAVKATKSLAYQKMGWSTTRPVDTGPMPLSPGHKPGFVTVRHLQDGSEGQSPFQIVRTQQALDQTVEVLMKAHVREEKGHEPQNIKQPQANAQPQPKEQPQPKKPPQPKKQPQATEPQPKEQPQPKKQPQVNSQPQPKKKPQPKKQPQANAELQPKEQAQVKAQP